MKLMMNRSIQIPLAALISLALSSVATATIIESEINNTLATANLIDRTSPIFADVGVPTLDPAGDVDVFSIELMTGDLLLANTAGIEGIPIGSDPDTIVALIDPSGIIIEFDDDDAQSLGSNFTTVIPSDGLYYIAVSGFGDSTPFPGSPVGEMFGDVSFIGDHTEAGTYILTVSVVPEPTTLALLGLALLPLLTLRRRNG